MLRLRRLKYHVAESARSFEIVLNCMSSGNRWNKSQASAIDVDCFNGGRDKQARLVVSCHITLNLQVAKALEITAIIVQTL